MSLEPFPNNGKADDVEDHLIRVIGFCSPYMGFKGFLERFWKRLFKAEESVWAKIYVLTEIGFTDMWLLSAFVTDKERVKVKRVRDLLYQKSKKMW